jgi:L,D-peptidoglycan transpeptidase YkuD (ErfK/YbiS/YcfS/YnhG family)
MTVFDEKSRRAPRRSMPRLICRSLNATNTMGWISAGPVQIRCSFGRGGMRFNKREGDGATPVGRFALLACLVRSDRVAAGRCALRRVHLRPDLGWCDDPNASRYNTLVRLGDGGARAEILSRSDALYDRILVLDHNVWPRRRGAGSAIFLHVRRADGGPTEGCVAVSEPDLRRLCSFLSSSATIEVARPEVAKPLRSSSAKRQSRAPKIVEPIRIWVEPSCRADS